MNAVSVALMPSMMGGKPILKSAVTFSAPPASNCDSCTPAGSRLGSVRRAHQKAAVPAAQSISAESRTVEASARPAPFPRPAIPEVT